jgi:hypothetical protein
MSVVLTNIEVQITWGFSQSKMCSGWHIALSSNFVSSCQHLTNEFTVLILFRRTTQVGRLSRSLLIGIFEHLRIKMQVHCRGFKTGVGALCRITVK